MAQNQLQRDQEYVFFCYDQIENEPKIHLRKNSRFHLAFVSRYYITVASLYFLNKPKMNFITPFLFTLVFVDLGIDLQGISPLHFCVNVYTNISSFSTQIKQL